MARQHRLQVIGHFGTGRVGAEIGVFKGDFSQMILNNAHPEKLYLIDPWENQKDPGLAKSWYAADSENDMNDIYTGVQKRFAEQIAAGSVQLLRDYATGAMSLFDDETLDFVYVDGDHRYESVLSDLEMSFAKVRPGGVIAADDYAKRSWYKDGVVRAVNAFIGKNATGLEILYASGAQVVLRKNP